MIFLRLVLAASVAGLSTFGCDEEDDDGLFSDNARIYFHNQLTQVGGGSEDDVTVDLFVDNQNSPVQDDVGYTITGNVSAESIELDDDSESLSFDTRGSSSGSTLVNGPLNRTLTAVGSGQIRVRFINTLSRLSGDELSVVTPGAAGQSLVSGLEYAEGSNYVSVNASGTLEVTVNNETQGLEIDQVSCSVSSGRSYDAIIAYRRFDSDDDQIALFCQPFN